MARASSDIYGHGKSLEKLTLELAEEALKKERVEPHKYITNSDIENFAEQTSDSVFGVEKREIGSRIRSWLRALFPENLPITEGGGSEPKKGSFNEFWKNGLFKEYIDKKADYYSLILDQKALMKKKDKNADIAPLLYPFIYTQIMFEVKDNLQPISSHHEKESMLRAMINSADEDIVGIKNNLQDIASGGKGERFRDYLSLSSKMIESAINSFPDAEAVLSETNAQSIYHNILRTLFEGAETKELDAALSEYADMKAFEKCEQIIAARKLNHDRTIKAKDIVYEIMMELDFSSCEKSMSKKTFRDRTMNFVEKRIASLDTTAYGLHRNRRGSVPYGGIFDESKFKKESAPEPPRKTRKVVIKREVVAKNSDGGKEQAYTQQYLHKLEEEKRKDKIVSDFNSLIDGPEGRIHNYWNEMERFATDETYKRNALLSMRSYLFDKNYDDKGRESKIRQEMLKLDENAKENKFIELWHKYRNRGGAAETIFNRHFGGLGLTPEMKYLIMTSSRAEGVRVLKEKHYYMYFPKPDIDNQITMMQAEAFQYLWKRVYSNVLTEKKSSITADDVKEQVLAMDSYDSMKSFICYCKNLNSLYQTRSKHPLGLSFMQMKNYALMKAMQCLFSLVDSGRQKGLKSKQIERTLSPFYKEMEGYASLSNQNYMPRAA